MDTEAHGLMLMQQHLKAHRFAEALQLATACGSDTDAVYQAQWAYVSHTRRVRGSLSLSLSLTLARIAAILDNICDTQWVLDVCRSQVLSTAEATRCLLKYGLSKTLHVNLLLVQRACSHDLDMILSPPDSRPDSGAPAVSTTDDLPLHVWCEYRASFLSLLDRLDSHESLYHHCKPHSSIATSRNLSFLNATAVPTSEPSLFFPIHYHWFRSCSLFDLARFYAESEQLANLSHLVSRYSSVFHRRLDLLDFVPLHITVSENPVLQKLLPGSDHAIAFVPWRKPDWSESRQVEEYILMMKEGKFLDDDEPPAEKTSDPEIDTRGWYISRALLCENFGFVNQAVDLLLFAQSDAHVENLDPLMLKLKILHKLPDSIKFADFDRLAVESVVHLLLKNTDIDSIVETLVEYVVPFLQTSNENTVDVLEEWMVETAKHDVLSCAAILNGWNGFGNNSQRVAVRCALAYDGVDDILQVERMYQSCHHWHASSSQSLPNSIKKPTGNELQEIEQDGGWDDDLDIDLELEAMDSVVNESELEAMDEGVNESELEQWAAKGKQLEAIFEVVRIVSQYSFSKPLNWYLNLDHHRLLLSHMLQRANDYNLLVSHIRELRSLSIFTETSMQELLVLIVKHMLSKELFHETTKLLFPETGLPLLPVHVVEELVVDAALEFFDNALESDMTKGLLKSAFTCLRIVPQSPSTTPLLNLIHAIHTLSRLGILIDPETFLPLLPIQVRLHPDRLEFVEKLVARDYKSYYNNLPFVIDLAEKLGATEDEGKQLRCRVAVADAALKSGHYNEAVSECFELMQLMQSSSSGNEEIRDKSWRLCVRVASKTRIDPETRKRIAAFAMSLCPVSQVDSVLELWREIDLVQSIVSETDKIVKDGGGRKDFFPETLDQASELLLAQPSQNTTSGEDEVMFEVDDYYGDVRLPVPRKRSSPIKKSWRSRARLEGLYIARKVRKQVLGLLEDNAKDEEASKSNDVDDCILRIAKADKKFGTVAALLSCRKDDSVISFFNSFSEDVKLQHKQFSCYIFSLRALNLLRPLSPTPFDFRGLPGNAVITLASSIQLTDFDNIWGIRFAETSKLAQERYQKKSERAVDTILRTAKVDAQLWDSDAEYRGRELTRMGKTVSVQELSKALVVAKITREEEIVVLSHLEYLFSAGGSEMIRECVEQIYGVENVEYGKIVQGLGGMNHLISGTDHEKRGLLYECMINFLNLEDEESDQMVVAALQNRIDILKLLQSRPEFSGIDFHLFFKTEKSEDVFESTILELWQTMDVTTRTGVEDFITIISRLIQLNPISLLSEDFEGEPLTHEQILNLTERISSSVYLSFVIRLFTNVDWEELDTESVDEFLEDIVSYCDVLDMLSIVQVCSLLTVGSKGVRIPIKSRQRFLKEIQSYVYTLKQEEVYAALEELNAISTHLSLISSLILLNDPNTDDKIPHLLLRDFDLAFGSEVEDFADLCVNMALQGVSPLLINSTCKLLIAAIQASATNTPSDSPRSSVASASYTSLRRLDVRSVYIRAMKSALDLESPDDTIATIDCILTSVIQYMLLNDLDEWEPMEDSLEDIDCNNETKKVLLDLKRILKKCLTDIIQQSPVGHTFNNGIHAIALKLFKKHFGGGKEFVALQNHRFAATCQAAWGIEVDSGYMDDDMDEKTELVGYLLSLTETVEQALTLREILIEWDPRFRVEEIKRCWADFMIWMARNEQFGLLLITRLMLTKYFSLSFGVESQLLETLQEFDIIEYWKHGLFSSNQIIVETTAENLLKELAQLSSGVGDWILHLLIAVRGYSGKICSTSTWPEMCKSLRGDYSASSVHPSYSIPLIDIRHNDSDEGTTRLQRGIMRLVISDVTASGNYSYAASLLYSYTGSRVLTGLLGTDENENLHLDGGSSPRLTDSNYRNEPVTLLCILREIASLGKIPVH